MHTDERAAAEANRLYWDSETPIAEIADRLDLSRRALYDAVDPVSAGVRCARCGGEMQYGNRSARKAGYAACASCGSEELVDPESASAARAAPQLAVVAGEAADSVRHDMRAPDLRHRAVVLGGVAIAGVAIGSVAAWLATRRE
jgi:DNA-directed RNA polymerase subunit RPC12/RpoP